MEIIKAKQGTFIPGKIGTLFRQAYIELGKNDPLRMAGATAFFTTFALPPILIILIQVLGLVFDPQKISKELFDHLSDIIGISSTQQVIATLTAFRRMAQNWLITLGGFIFLLFVATTLFKVIKSSLNQVWKIRAVERVPFKAVLGSRLISIMVIVLAGVLFVIGLIAEGGQAFLWGYMKELLPNAARYFNSVLNYLVSVVIVTIWFAFVFRFLPDARPQWHVALTGAFVTSLLFNLGRLILHWLLSYSNIDNLYGASGSIVLLLLFVFYSSLILYFGAAFTKVWGISKGCPIEPLPHAIHYQIVEADGLE
ncbi:YihY/virulence factor BrkB family protein [Chitinophagaceae bacterium LB-8]|uniref:YihY/virulence factor BrkB family protein n=1 Tax=Paraflavisolibacter caeni TaxID=2982496 RepID=A0A9X2XRW4_9BACT|nr:YihY/virulence factor BrkB family protein [Paraflavisolibacter caeni]MCU7547616.1 YihY/virulence factor BrkB family protein [Paraflavisolibacter caeni]